MKFAFFFLPPTSYFFHIWRDMDTLVHVRGFPQVSREPWLWLNEISRHLKGVVGRGDGWKLCVHAWGLQPGTSLYYNSHLQGLFSCLGTWLWEEGGISLIRLWSVPLFLVGGLIPALSCPSESSLLERKLPLSCLAMQGREEDMGTQLFFI